MDRNNFVIGILGGCGTYATINAFRQYADVFPAVREWERPRIIIDNNCVMPSRVRAYLYNENRDILIKAMTDSFELLINAGANYIIVGCNTAHLFLEEVYELLPLARKKTINLIDECVKEASKERIKKVFILGSEGTIDSGIYQKSFNSVGIECKLPNIEDYRIIRECIEAVKQNKYTAEIKKFFLELLEGHDTVVLGCTELPILYEKYVELESFKVIDPMKIALLRIKKIYDQLD